MENNQFEKFLSDWMPSLNEHPDLTLQVNRGELVRMLRAAWDAAIVSLEAVDQPEGCELVACHDGEGWSLSVEDNGQVVALIDWPSSWPAVLTGDELREKGFTIV